MAPLDEGRDTEPNMTPMIDLVFQLVVFFLLTLRFPTTEQRIDAQLPRGGPDKPTMRFDAAPIRVRIFRKEISDPERAFTRIRVGSAEYDLPAGDWPSGGAALASRRARYDEVYARLTAQIRAMAEAQRQAAPDAPIRGKVVARPPDGPAVPHGDVIRTVDAFLAADVRDVVFEGVAEPRGS